MSKNTSNSAPLGELFVDATKEVIEKGRIKAQMMRLNRIMEADRERKKGIYAEIGKMYVDGTITTNKGKLSYALKALKHLDLRLERAEARYDMLREAQSLDECTEAFRQELSKKITKAKDSAAIAAYGVKKKAKKIVSGIGEKSSDVAYDIKTAANNINIGKKKAKQIPEETEETKDFQTLLAELEIANTEEEIEENAELNAVLSNIDAILREVEEEAEQETAQEEICAPAQDGESAESFDF